MTTTTSKLTPRLAIGLTLLWLGTFWILSQAGVSNAHRLAELWPVGIILLAVAVALNGGGWVSTLVVGFVGIWLLNESIGLFRFDIGDLWPLVLVFFGIRLIMKGTGMRRLGTGAMPTGADRFRSIAILGNREHQVEGSDFERADATAFLGSSKIDLRRSTFEEATIDALCLAAGINITVSPDTRVISSVVPVMAGYEDKRTERSEPSRTLYLRGVVIWGGIEVYSAPTPRKGDES